MVLKALEVHGFKSFPDKTVLNFGQGITAVVGPNGSGKSNISDAIRWVLGEQSSKSLRGSKMEDVVFSGTAARKGMGFAEVSLVIDNTTRLLDFDADDVKVTRRYYRSGDSEYLLNNATVRLRDVQLLFMDTGLGRDGYSIIGQGRIGDIVASKSEERREIFEEAAGIAKYRFRKNEAERRLKSAEDNLLRLQDILQELEERVGPLAQQSEKAKKFLEYAAEKKELEIGLWLHTIRHARETMRDLGSKLELARTQHEGAGDAIDALETELEQVSVASQQLTVQMDEMRRAAASLEEEATRCDGEAAVLNNDIFHNNENIQRIRGEQARSEEGDQTLEADMARLREGIAQKRETIAQTEKDRLALTEELEALARDTDEVTDRMTSLSQEASAVALQLSDARVRGVTAQSSLEEIERRLTQLTAGDEERTRQQAQVNEELAACREDHRLLLERMQELQNARTGYEMRARSRDAKLNTAKEAADKLFLDAEEARRRVRLLEELERNMEGFSGSVKAVMKQSERGALRGIHGPVSRLIQAKPEYALAIETALGAATQNIVCDREEDAKRAIAYLKETGGGRATFLPLTSIRGNLLNERGLAEEASVIGLASELVACDTAYENIAKSLLGRTAVTEDLDDAVAIARKYGYRFRVVTLDGQVVNAGGSMTGGSGVKNAGLLSRRAEIEKLTARAAEQARKAEQAKEQLRQAQQDAAAAQAELGGVQAELATAQEDKIRLEGELRRLEEQADSFARAAAQWESECASLRERAAECRASADVSAAEQAELAQRQQVLEADIAAIGSGREELTRRREELSTRIGDKRLAALACEKEIEAHNTALIELQARQADAVGYRAALEAQIVQLQEAGVRIGEQVAALTERAAALREQAAAGGEQVEALIRQRGENEARVTELRRQSREKAEERERVGREVARLEEKYAAAERDADDVVRKLYEEYELTRAEAEAVAKEIDDLPAANRRLAELKSRIRALGSVNVDAIEEYKEVKERYDFLSEQVRDVEVSRDELLKLINDLTGQMKEMFLERFKQINYHFGIVFTELFGGGRAELALSEPEDVLRSGIEMHVQPPGKKILNLDSLSGGEKALVAIALLFAILKVTPSPFCVLDEIEAALDDVNVDRYAHYLRRMCDNTQFIVITHRRGTMEEADVLYGVTMQEKGVSKLLELRVGEVEEKLGMQLQTT